MFIFLFNPRFNLNEEPLFTTEQIFRILNQQGTHDFIPKKECK